MRREQVEALAVIIGVYAVAAVTGVGIGWLIHVVTRGRML